MNTENETAEDRADDAPAGGESAPSAAETHASPSPADELPEWARKELAKVRDEAAGYRTKLRDAEQQLETRVGELTVAQADLERRVLVEQAARKHALPDDLAALVQGADADAIEAHASTLAKYAAGPVESGPLSGGLNPSDSDEGGFDPVAVAMAARSSRY